MGAPPRLQRRRHLEQACDCGGQSFAGAISRRRVPAMQAIVKTIITLGKSLGVTVTAEGVESEDQAAMLRDFGCQQAQGFLFGQPGAPDATDMRAKVTPLKPRPSAA